MAIKSVPPEELSARRQRTTATAFKIPPKTAHKRMSSVRSGQPRPESRSVKRPEMKIITTLKNVKRFPMYLKPIMAGTRLKA